MSLNYHYYLNYFISSQLYKISPFSTMFCEIHNYPQTWWYLDLSLYLFAYQAFSMCKRKFYIYFANSCVFCTYLWYFWCIKYSIFTLSNLSFSYLFYGERGLLNMIMQHFFSQFFKQLNDCTKKIYLKLTDLQNHASYTLIYLILISICYILI